MREKLVREADFADDRCELAAMASPQGPLAPPLATGFCPAAAVLYAGTFRGSGSHQDRTPA
jgi:hypothetical protein